MRVGKPPTVESVTKKVNGWLKARHMKELFAVDIDDLARDNGLEPEDKLREGALMKILVKDSVLRRWKRKAGKYQKSVRQQRKKNKAEG